MTTRRVLLAVAVLIGAASVVFAVKPFDRPGLLTEHGFFLASDRSCGAPVVAAWRDRHDDAGGWFGYAPLTSTPLTSMPVTTCRGEGQRRLAIAVLGLLGAGALTFAARRTRPGAPRL